MRRGDDGALRGVAHDFYDAAYGGGPLFEPLGRLAHRLGADGAGILRGRLADTRATMIDATWGITRESIELYRDRYRSIDPWTPKGLEQPPMRAFRTRELLPRRALEPTQFYQDYLRPHRIGGFTGTYVRGRSGLQVALAFHHGDDREALGEDVSRAVDRIFPAVARAIDVAGRLSGLEARVRDLESTVDALATPMVLVGRRAPFTVRHANQAALTALRVETGVAVQGGRLLVANRRDSAALAQVVAGHGPGGIEGGTLELRGAEGATTVAVRRLPAGQAACPMRGPSVALIFEAPNTLPTWAAALTPRQREVAELLAHGATSPEAARHLGLGVETVRTHVKAIYDRLGIASRAELARQVAAG
jgi:DNA-binding CsgD family transcriptional regulator